MEGETVTDPLKLNTLRLIKVDQLNRKWQKHGGQIECKYRKSNWNDTKNGNFH
jgi:hypothetical protein